MGIHGNPTRCNIANANQNRDWRIYAEFAQILISEAKKLYQAAYWKPDLNTSWSEK